MRGRSFKRPLLFIHKIRLLRRVGLRSLIGFYRVFDDYFLPVASLLIALNSGDPAAFVISKSADSAVVGITPD